MVNDEKRIMEAALFISARELSVDDLKRITGIAAGGYLKKKMDELKKEYETIGSSIEISEENGKYLMKIRNEYIEKVKDFAQEVEVSKGALRVLGYIYKKGGTLKSDVAKRLGSWIYPYVKELIDAGFLEGKKHGRTSKLKLTEKFKRYFGEIKEQV